MCQSKECNTHETKLRNLATEGADYLIGSCNALFELRGVFQEELEALCPDPEKFEAFCEDFEEAVIAETTRLEYFQCENCGWWCWADERSDNTEEQTCTDCEWED